MSEQGKKLVAFLDRMMGCEPLERSVEHNELAEKVAIQSQQPETETVEEWAGRLSKQLSKLTD